MTIVWISLAVAAIVTLLLLAILVAAGRESGERPRTLQLDTPAARQALARPGLGEKNADSDVRRGLAGEPSGRALAERLERGDAA